ncbi:MAG: FAD-dependent monooxygenase [Chloroflexota bacterium]
MFKKYDVIIVGAGPAGLLAAKAAGENGLDVALLERKSDPTKLTRACGQTLISMNEYFFGNLGYYNRRDKRICFSSAGFSFRYDGPVQNNYNLNLITPEGHWVRFGDYAVQKAKGDNGRIGLSFDKEALFRSLLEECKACHVDVFGGVLVDKVTLKTDRIVVEGSGKSFEGTYCIAADGCNSKVAEVMGMNDNRYYFCNFIGLSEYVSGIQGPEPDQIIKLYAHLKDGSPHYYLIPLFNPGEFNVLTVTVDPRVNLDNAAHWLRQGSVIKDWFKKAKVTRRFAASCACYSPIKDAYKDRVLITGDVGSTQELEIAGAMISGWKAGQAVSTAVRENKIGIEVNGVSEYTKWWLDTYINYYSHEAYMRGMTLPYILRNEEEIEAVYGLIDETLAPCWNPYTGSKAMAGAMPKALSLLEKTRPELVQRLRRGREAHPKDLLAEITAISRPPGN